jgi:hypothetical protein
MASSPSIVGASKLIIILLVKWYKTVCTKGIWLSFKCRGYLTRGSNDHSVSVGLLADKVVDAVTTSVAVGGNFALAPEAETIEIG